MAEEETKRDLRRPLARKEKVSGVELAKRASRHLRGGIRESLVDAEPELAEPDRRVAKLHGIYRQEDRDARSLARVTGAARRLNVISEPAPVRAESAR